MKNIFSILCILIFISCSTEPQPLVSGKDECNFCKMPVADIRYGAEIITVKGKLYKFDDIGCLNNFLKNGLSADEKVKNILVVNYTNNQNFLDVHKAQFLISSNLHSPMNSGVAAFESQKQTEYFLKDFPGEILTWHQLQAKLK